MYCTPEEWGMLGNTWRSTHQHFEEEKIFAHSPFRCSPPWCLAQCVFALCSGSQSERAPRTFDVLPGDQEYVERLGGITVTLTTIVGILVIITTITRNKPANRQDILPQAPRPVSHWRDLELASSRVTLLPGAWPFGKKNADYKQNISFKNYLT